MVATGGQRSHRPTITPNKTCSANLYRRIKRRGTWSLQENKLHINYLELKAVFLALKEFQDICTDKIVLVATDNTTVVSYINKEGGMRSSPYLCPSMENLDLVHQPSSNSQSPTHRPSRPDHSNRMVPPSRGFFKPYAAGDTGPT